MRVYDSWCEDCKKFFQYPIDGKRICTRCKKLGWTITHYNKKYYVPLWRQDTY